MERQIIEIVMDDPLETLRRCDGYYACPKGPDGKRLGPLVAYAGKYGPEGDQKRFIGHVYANFAKAEPYPDVLKHFAVLLSQKLEWRIGLKNIDVFCGAPIGGYSLCDALGFHNGTMMIKAEKQVIRPKTDQNREESQVVFGRHSVEKGQRVVIVEDVCNNFSTTYELVGAIMARGGIVAGIACFLNRSLTVDDTYKPGEIFLRSRKPLEGTAMLEIPVVSIVRLPINEWKQDNPAVAEDVAAGNVVWDPKKEWGRLMEAMSAEGGKAK